ncbi:MAG: divalent-cation tolerance protein CutA [Nitrosopumilus sp.]|nr:divalent-cation tolerance protein CutA [Nitrosopumilus sp.]
MVPVILVSTYPDRASASRAADGAVGARLAACVNIARISSTYRWEGRIERGTEYVALFKTDAASRAGLRRQIASTHPYDVPEIAEIPVRSVNAPYMAWITDSTSGTAAGRRSRQAR